MGDARAKCIDQLTGRSPRQLDFFSRDGPASPPPQSMFASLFGVQVFGKREMEKCLPKPVYASFMEQILEGRTMDRPVTDDVAHAVRIWAQANGATHYTHWFQPQTNSTAEKHDSFLCLKAAPTGISMDAEPDASSFPHGGSRTTFEARGYTVWDPTSPMFLQSGPHSTTILYIPSIFISYHGDALDEKTGLLRSIEAVSRASCRLLHILGHRNVQRVIPTLGTEQEFFLVDRSLYLNRPDLRLTGRTLLGHVPPKHQQLEDHYFGNIPTRVLAAISEAELELWRLGVPIKTRHNEVAPNQFEVAPIFEDANIAVDHNLLTMETIHKVAHRHSLKALFHEKPFKGVNGSGKHCNWSLATDTGINLLEPSDNPEENFVFLLTLVSVLLAVHQHGPLLRASIASASNDHRLGANEAPPAIVSVFLGDYLSAILDSVESGHEDAIASPLRPPLETKKVSIGARTLDVQVSTMPSISRDPTDRNRTSPFAFTGNKFEFRAVGSKQSPSFPVTVLNAAMAQALNQLSESLEQKSDRGEVSKQAIMEVLREAIKKTRPVRFEGDNYSREWQDEAAKRGLANIPKAPDSYSLLNSPSHRHMLVSESRIYSDAELDARYHVFLEKYVKDVLIEAGTLRNMVRQLVFPAAFSYKKTLGESIASLGSVSCSSRPEKGLLDSISGELDLAYSVFLDLEAKVSSLEPHRHSSDVFGTAKEAEALLPLMEKLRGHVDALEAHLPDALWTLPTYADLFFTS